MTLFLLLIIGALVTALLIKTHKIVPAILAALVTTGLLFAAVPGLGTVIADGFNQANTISQRATEDHR